MQEYEITCKGKSIAAIDILYPYSAIRDWIEHFPDRSQLGYPTNRNTHLFVTSKKVPAFWFAEAFVSRHFEQCGYQTWSETYHLHSPPDTEPNMWNCANPEIFQLLGTATVTELQRAIAESRITPWANPDVIAYSAADNKWLFLECKLIKDAWPEIGIRKSQDTIKSHQVESLQLLEGHVDNSRSLVVHVRPE